MTIQPFVLPYVLSGEAAHTNLIRGYKPVQIPANLYVPQRLTNQPIVLGHYPKGNPITLDTNEYRDMLKLYTHANQLVDKKLMPSIKPNKWWLTRISNTLDVRCLDEFMKQINGPFLVKALVGNHYHVSLWQRLLEAATGKAFILHSLYDLEAIREKSKSPLSSNRQIKSSLRCNVSALSTETGQVVFQRGSIVSQDGVNGGIKTTDLVPSLKLNTQLQELFKSLETIGKGKYNKNGSNAQLILLNNNQSPPVVIHAGNRDCYLEKLAKV